LVKSFVFPLKIEALLLFFRMASSSNFRLQNRTLMKALVSYLAVAALIVASSFTVSQQKQLNQQSTTSCFSHFNVHRAGKANIELAWTISSADVTQFVVERSYDGDFYENVTTVNFNGSSSYKSKDTGVFPGVIYYRVTAVKSDGTTECSPVETIRIMQHG